MTRRMIVKIIWFRFQSNPQVINNSPRLYKTAKLQQKWYPAQQVNVIKLSFYHLEFPKYSSKKIQ